MDTSNLIYWAQKSRIKFLKVTAAALEKLMSIPLNTNHTSSRFSKERLEKALQRLTSPKLVINYSKKMRIN